MIAPGTPRAHPIAPGVLNRRRRKVGGKLNPFDNVAGSEIACAVRVDLN